MNDLKDGLIIAFITAYYRQIFIIVVGGFAIMNAVGAVTDAVIPGQHRAYEGLITGTIVSESHVSTPDTYSLGEQDGATFGETALEVTIRWNNDDDQYIRNFDFMCDSAGGKQNVRANDYDGIMPHQVVTRTYEITNSLKGASERNITNCSSSSITVGKPNTAGKTSF